MLNTKQIGNVTEVECMLAFLKLGYNVLTPYGDCERYDFVVDINGELLKIQVKTSSDHTDEGYIIFNCSNKTTRNGTFVRHQYTKEEIDYFMTSFNGKCYLIPVEETSAREKRLRFKPPKNGQTKGITFAADYELEKVVAKIVNK